MTTPAQDTQRAEGASVDQSRRYWLVVDDRGVAVTPSLHDDEERATTVLKDFRRRTRPPHRRAELRVARVVLTEVPDV